MALVYLGLGSNLGDKEKYLCNAIERIEQFAGIVKKKSTVFSSKPWGFESENNFQNMVILIETELKPFELLKITQEIELKSGRTKKTKTEFTDRVIDIDILLYDDIVINTIKLNIPHKHLIFRDFVLIPLLEIAPDLKHPVTNKKISEYLKS